MQTLLKSMVSFAALILFVFFSSIQAAQEKPYFFRSVEELLKEGQTLRLKKDYPNALRVLFLAQSRIPLNDEEHPLRESVFFEYELCRCEFALQQRDPVLLEQAASRFGMSELTNPKRIAQSRYMAALCTLFLVSNQNSTSWDNAYNYLFHACELEPENIAWHKKLLWTQLKTGRFDEAQTLLESLLSKQPKDVFLHEAAAMKIALQLQHQRNPTPDWDLVEKGLEHAFTALELSKEKRDPEKSELDLFEERVKDFVTPVNWMREIVSPSDYKAYIKRMRELKTNNANLWEQIAPVRLRFSSNEQQSNAQNEQLSHVLQEMMIPNENNPIFCLEYGLTFNLRDENGYLQGMHQFERVIKDGTLRGTGLFHRGDANNWRGVGGQQPELLEKSTTDFQAAVKLAPDWVYAYLKLGWSHWHGKRFMEAEKAFQKGLALAPEYRPMMQGLGNVYLESWKHGNKENPDLINKAIYYAKRLENRGLENYCRNELKSVANNDFRTVPEAFTVSDVNQKGDNLLLEEDFKDALECFEWMKEKSPDPGENSMAYAKAAGVYYTQKNWEKVLENLAFCDIETSATEIEPLEMLAHALCELKHYDVLADYYQNVLVKNPNYNKLGMKQIYFALALKNTKKATPQEVYEAMSNTYGDPSFTSYSDLKMLLFMANTAASAKEYDNARNCFNNILQIDDGKHYQYALQLAKINLEAKQYSLAVDAYEKFLEHEPDNENVKRQLLNALYRDGDYGRCLEQLLQSIQKQPGDKLYWRQLVAVLEKVQGPQREIFAPLIAKDVPPENIADYDDILESKINVERILGFREEAIRDLTILLRRGKTAGRFFLSRPGEKECPHKTSVENSLALLYMSVEKPDEAVKVLTPYLARLEAIPSGKPTKQDLLQKETAHGICADIYMLQEKWKQAVPHLEAVEKNQRSKEPKLLLYLGNCYLKSGDAIQAGKVFSRCLSLDPECYEANLGRYEAAMMMLKDRNVQSNATQKEIFVKQANADLQTLRRAKRMIELFPPQGRKTLSVSTLQAP